MKKKISKMDILTLIMKYLLNSGLGGEFTSESWTASNSYETEPNQSGDTGLLIAVIILAAIILVLLGGAGVAYLYYVRSVFWAHMYLSYQWPSDSYFLQLILCLVKFLVVSLAVWHEKVHEFSISHLIVFDAINILKFSLVCLRVLELSFQCLLYMADVNNQHFFYLYVTTFYWIVFWLKTPCSLKCG